MPCTPNKLCKPNVITTYYVLRKYKVYKFSFLSTNIPAYLPNTKKYFYNTPEGRA